MEILTIKQYAESRQLSDKLIRRLILSGDIPAGKCGNKYLLNGAKVDEFFVNLTTATLKTPAPTISRSRRKNNTAELDEMLAQARKRLLG